MHDQHRQPTLTTNNKSAQSMQTTNNGRAQPMQATNNGWTQFMRTGQSTVNRHRSCRQSAVHQHRLCGHTQQWINTAIRAGQTCSVSQHVQQHVTRMRQPTAHIMPNNRQPDMRINMTHRPCRQPTVDHGSKTTTTANNESAQFMPTFISGSSQFMPTINSESSQFMR